MTIYTLKMFYDNDFVEFVSMNFVMKERIDLKIESLNKRW